MKVTYNVCDNFEEVQKLVNDLIPFTMPITIKTSHISFNDLKSLLTTFQ